MGLRPLARELENTYTALLEREYADRGVTDHDWPLRRRLCVFSLLDIERGLYERLTIGLALVGMSLARGYLRDARSGGGGGGAADAEWERDRRWRPARFCTCFVS